MAGNGPNIETTFTVNMDDLVTGLNKVNKEVNHNKQVFDAATSGMDDWKTSSEGLNAKLTQLKGNLSLYTGSLTRLEQEYQRVEAAGGDNSATLENLNKKILTAKKNIGNTERQIRKYEQQLREMETTTEETTTETGKLDKALGKLKEASQTASQGFTVVKGVLSQVITRTLTAAVQSISAAVASAGELRKELGMLEATANTTGASFDKAKDNLIEVSAITDDTAAAVEGLNNLMTAGFDGSSLDEITDLLTGAAIKWKDTLKFEGLSDGLQETLATGKAIGPFAELLDRAGVSQDEFNRRLASAKTEAEKQQIVLETLSKLGLKEVKDEYEELNGSLVANNKAYAENQMALAEINEAIEPVRTALLKIGTVILKHITPAIEKVSGMLTKLFTGDFKGAADDFVGIIQIVRDKIVNFAKSLIENLPTILQTVVDTVVKYFTGLVNIAEDVGPQIIGGLINSIGEILKLLPDIIDKVVDEVIVLFPRLLEVTQTLVGKLLKELPGLLGTLFGEVLPQIINSLSKLVGSAIPPFIESVIEALMGLVEALGPLLKEIVKALPPLLVSILGFIADNLPVIVKAIGTLIGGILDVILELGEQIGSVIPTIIAAIVEWFLNGFPTLLRGCIQLFGALLEAIITVAPKLYQYIPTLIGKIITGLVKGIVQFVRTGGEWVKGLWNGIKNSWGSLVESVVSLCDNLIQKIVSFFTSAGDKFKSIGGDIIKGIGEGLSSGWNWLKDKVVEVGDNIVGWFEDVFDINSPSKLMKDTIGKNIGLGIGEGILDSIPEVTKDLSILGKSITGGLQGVTGDISMGRITSPTVNGRGMGGQVINSNFTVNYNGNLSRKQLKKLEIDNYTSIKTKLRREGAI